MPCSRMSTRCGNFRNSSSSSHDFIGVIPMFSDLRCGNSTPGESTKPPAAPSAVAGCPPNSESGFDVITRCSRRGNAWPRRRTSDQQVMAFELKKKWVTDGNVWSAGSSMLVYSLKLRWSSRSLWKHSKKDNMQFSYQRPLAAYHCNYFPV